MTQPDHQRCSGQENLAERLRQSPRAAIPDLYDTYAPALFGIVLRIVQSEPAAEDVLQETFIKIWTHHSSFDPEKGSLFTWMLNIARRTAIDHLRSKENRISRSTEIMNDHKHGGHTYTGIDTLGLREQVAGLESKFSQVLELVYFKGYTHREVQKALGLPLGTVKSRIRLALKQLRVIYTAQVPPILVLLAQSIFMSS